MEPLQTGLQLTERICRFETSFLALLDDFSRFDNPWPFLRTHPYIVQRRADLARYLEDTGQLGPTAGPTPASEESRRPAGAGEEERRRLRQLQQLYPEGSVSWNNLQRQIDALDREGRHP